MNKFEYTISNLPYLEQHYTEHIEVRAVSPKIWNDWIIRDFVVIQAQIHRNSILSFRIVIVNLIANS